MNQVDQQVENDFEWYSLKVISGKELTAKDNILFEAGLALDQLKNTRQYAGSSEEEKTKLINGVSDFIEQILVPSEKVIEIRNNKKKTKEKMFFPGYILINMKMNAQTKYIVENTQSVIRFIGPKNQDPIPLRNNEIKRIMGEVERKEGVELIAAPEKSNSRSFV